VELFLNFFLVVTVFLWIAFYYYYDSLPLRLGQFQHACLFGFIWACDLYHIKNLLHVDFYLIIPVRMEAITDNHQQLLLLNITTIEQVSLASFRLNPLPSHCFLPCVFQTVANFLRSGIIFISRGL